MSAVGIIIIVLGALVGSFLNLVADRTLKGGKIVFGRSRCDGCGMVLKPINLIPLFSYIFQRGRCTNCNDKLSILYPVSEVITSAAFYYSAQRSGLLENYYEPMNIALFIFLAVTLSFFIILFLTDLKENTIPNSIVLPAIIFVFLGTVAFQAYSVYSLNKSLHEIPVGQYFIRDGYINKVIMKILYDYMKVLLSATLLAGFFQFLIVVTKGKGMGGGDVTLAFLISIFNGYPDNVVAIFLGFLLGAVVSVTLVLSKKKGMKDTIAFGPFLITGSMIALVWGEQIIKWYTSLGA